MESVETIEPVPTLPNDLGNRSNQFGCKQLLKIGRCCVFRFIGRLRSVAHDVVLICYALIVAFPQVTFPRLRASPIRFGFWAPIAGLRLLGPECGFIDPCRSLY